MTFKFEVSTPHAPLPKVPSRSSVREKGQFTSAIMALEPGMAVTFTMTEEGDFKKFRTNVASRSAAIGQKCAPQRKYMTGRLEDDAKVQVMRLK